MQDEFEPIARESMSDPAMCGGKTTPSGVPSVSISKLVTLRY